MKKRHHRNMLDFQSKLNICRLNTYFNHQMRHASYILSHYYFPTKYVESVSRHCEVIIEELSSVHVFANL